MRTFYSIPPKTGDFFAKSSAREQWRLSSWKEKNQFSFVLTIASLILLCLASLPIQAMSDGRSTTYRMAHSFEIKKLFSKNNPIYPESEKAGNTPVVCIGPTSTKTPQLTYLSPTASCIGNDPAGQAPAQGLYAEYFAGDFSATNNQAFFTTNTPALIRTDTSINFPIGDFGAIIPPASGSASNPQYFSARYRGSISIPTAGVYTFYLTSDDGSFLWIDNAALLIPAQSSQALISNGGSHAAKTIQASVYLAAGPRNLLIHYGQGNGGNKLVLEFSRPGISRQVVPKSVLCTSVQPMLTNLPVSASYAPTSATIEVNSVFASNVPTVNDGGAPIAYYMLANAASLPNGISMNSTTGTIHANATVPIGSYVVDVAISNANGTTTVSNVFALTVAPPASPAECTSNDPGSQAPMAAVYAEYYNGYFNNNQSYFTNSPALVRYEGSLNYTDNFGGTPSTPIGGLQPSSFSGRYRTSIYIATTGVYSFYFTCDDAGYMWLDEGTLDRPAQVSRVFINNGGSHISVTKQASRYLQPGLHNILIHYGNGSGNNQLLLEYSGPGITRMTVPASQMCTSVQKLFANPDSYTTNYNTVLAGTSVLTNDIDSTNSGQPLTISLITAPLHGSITFNANGTFNYVPTTGFVGPDSLVYQVCSSGSPSYCSRASVSILVNDPDYLQQGNAKPLAASCFHLTSETANQTAAVWRRQPFDLKNSFELRFDAHFSALGKTNDAGEGGLVFVMQNQGSGLLPMGSGAALGYSGITPSLGIEFDTYNNGNPADIAADHTSVLLHGATTSTPPLGPIAMRSNSSNVEDGVYHAIRIVWSKSANTLQVYVDNELRLTYVNDIAQNVFNNNSLITWGFTASTGSTSNEQGICSLVFTPLNDDPIAANDTYSTDEDTPLNGNVLSNDSDPNGNSLVLQTTPLTAPSKGTLTLNADGTFVYTPNLNIDGTDSFTYQVCDNGSPSKCSQATVTITINPINDAPVAVNDSYATNEDTPLTVVAPGVLTNDPDAESQSLTAVVISAPTKGTLNLNANGSFTYTPNANVNGPDTFTYQASDGSLSSNTATVTLTINAVNDAPVARGGSFVMDEDNSMNGDLFIGDSDPDGNNLMLQATPVKAPAKGTVKLNADGTFIYTPALNFNGTDRFIYRICDDGTPSLCSQDTVTIIIAPFNDAPIAKADTYVTDEDAPASGNVLNNDSDIENDALSVNSALIITPSKGSVKLNADGTFVYTPNPDANGTDSFTYQVCDNGIPTLCSQATVTIAINPMNDAPVAVNDEVDVYEDTPAIIPVLANDTDVDGPNLTSQVKTNPQFGKVTANNDGSFTYTPEKEYHGTDSFIYQVCDQGTPTLCAEAMVTIRIGQVSDETVVYEGISPNGDNQNDFWLIDHIDDYPQNTVRIFNRWGDLVFEITGYNNQDKVWTGEANQGNSVGNSQLPDGTYFYVLNLGNGSAPKKGYLVINR